MYCLTIFRVQRYSFFLIRTPYKKTLFSVSLRYAYALFHQPLHLVLRREQLFQAALYLLVSGNAHGLHIVLQHIFHIGLVRFLAENDADRGVLIGQLLLIVKYSQICRQLSKIRRLELALIISSKSSNVSRWLYANWI